MVGNAGISPLGPVGDQVTPDGARLLETVGSAEQPRERAPRAASPPTVRSISSARSSRSRRMRPVRQNVISAAVARLADEHLRIVQLLGEREPCFRVPRAFSVVTSRSCHPRKLGEDVHPLTDVDTWLRSARR